MSYIKPTKLINFIELNKVILLYRKVETKTGCHILWFWILEEAVFPFLSWVYVVVGFLGYIFPKNHSSIWLFRKKVLPQHNCVTTCPDYGLVVTGIGVGCRGLFRWGKREKNAPIQKKNCIKNRKNQTMIW